MITLETNYSKKIGLPGYSSHQFSITLRTEITDVNQVQGESARLYALLQQGVDTSIQQVGFLPTQTTNGQNGTAHSATNGNGNRNGYANGNGHTHGRSDGRDDAWACSPKQQDLILSMVEEHHLDKGEVEHLAQERFGIAVRQLNKLEASGLIDELIDTYGQKKSQSRRGGYGQNRYAQNGGRR